MNQTKVKVKTSELLAAVRKRREKLVAEYERTTEKYKQDTAVVAERVKEALAKATKAAERGEIPETSSHYRNGKYTTHLLVPIRGQLPDEPTLNTQKIDRLIRTLEMAAEETIAISAEDAAQYLG